MHSKQQLHGAAAIHFYTPGSQFVILVSIKMAMDHNSRFHDLLLCNSLKDYHEFTCVKDQSIFTCGLAWASVELFPPYWLSNVCNWYHQLNPCHIAM